MLILNILKNYNLRYFSEIKSSKRFEVVVSSLRVDRILATGLGLSRRKIEYSLLRGCVLLNGKEVSKKSIEVKEGDIVDNFNPDETTPDLFTIGRVKLIEIGQETKKGNKKVILERNKVVIINRDSYFEEFQ